MKRFPIHGIEIFLTIVREGSMRAAADALGIGAPAVSLQLKSLEERLGVDLLVRSTRSVEMTEAGRVLFEAAAPAHRDLVSAIRKAQAMSQSATGTLRLSLSRGAYMAAIAPVLDAFLAENPGINLELSWNEELVDIVRKGFHAGIRMGDLLAPDMIATRITSPVKSAFFASPAYLSLHGRPHRPEDLLAHQCIRHRQPTSGLVRDWLVRENGADRRIDAPARLVFDSAAGVIQAAREGHGIGWSMRVTMEEHVRSGELELVLDPFTSDLPPFYIYYPEQNKRVECLKILAAFLKARLSQNSAT